MINVDKIKFSQLDGLRGLAALAVVFSHFVNTFFPIATGVGAVMHSNYDFLFSSFPFTVLFGGHFAVCVFFVLSGFVLSIKYFKNPANSILIDSALRRYSRLMIPALVSVIFAYTLMKLNLMMNNQLSEITGSNRWLNGFWDFVPTLESALKEGMWGAFIDGLKSGVPTYNSSLWTMHIELVGSFMVFAFLALFGNVKKRWIAYTILFFICWGSYYLPFLLGIIISDLSINKSNIIKKIPSFVYPLFLMLSLYLGGWPTTIEIGSPYYFLQHSSLESFLNTSIVLVSHTFGALLLVVAAIFYVDFAKLLTIKPIVFLGKNSFSLYLIHLPLIGSFSSILFLALIKRLSYTEAVVIDVIVSLVLFLALSSFYTRFVDERAIQFSRRLEQFYKK